MGSKLNQLILPKLVIKERQEIARSFSRSNHNIFKAANKLATLLGLLNLAPNI
jgi:hypothetical protein